MVNMIKLMYKGVTMAVKCKGSESKEFEVKVGVHKAPVLSPPLCIIVLESLSRDFRESLQ